MGCFRVFVCRGGEGLVFFADARFSCPSGECVSPLASAFQRAGDVASRIVHLVRRGVDRVGADFCDAGDGSDAGWRGVS